MTPDTFRLLALSLPYVTSGSILGSDRPEVSGVSNPVPRLDRLRCAKAVLAGRRRRVGNATPHAQAPAQHALDATTGHVDGERGILHAENPTSAYSTFAQCALDACVTRRRG